MLDSLIDISKERMSELLKNYIDNAITLLKHENNEYAKRAIETVTRRRLFGLRSPLAVNPTPEEAVQIVKEKLKWYGFSRQSYKARRIQAKMFQDMMDSSDPDSKFLISVSDHAMLVSCDYSPEARWRSGTWDYKNDPAIKACY